MADLVPLIAVACTTVVGARLVASVHWSGPARRAVSSDMTSPRAHRRGAPFERLGSWTRAGALRVFGQRASVALEFLDDRRLALVLMAAAISSAWHWWAGLVVSFGAVLLGWRTSVRTKQTESDRRDAAAPLLVDLVRAGVASGATPRDTLLLLGSGPSPPSISCLRPALRDLAGRVESGASFSASLPVLSDASVSLRGLVGAVQSSERLGVAIGPTLDVLAVDARLARRRRVEARARRLPVLLLFPLVTCTLPAFGVLTVVPLLVSGLSSVRW
jgi:tight adherence protein C